jgi:hypothetical protein
MDTAVAICELETMLSVLERPDFEKRPHVLDKEAFDALIEETVFITRRFN